MIRRKHFILFYLFIHCVCNTFAQKPLIDTSVFNQWPSLQQNLEISSNGNYVSYVIINQPVGGNTLVVQSATNSWKKELVGLRQGFFSEDSRYFVYMSKDTVCILQTGTDKVTYLPDAENYMFPVKNKGKWIAYKLKTGAKEIVLYNILTTQQQRYSTLGEYAFENNGNALLLKSKNEAGWVLQWVSLKDMIVRTIWYSTDSARENASIGAHCFAPSGDQLAFIVQTKKADQLVNSIWYYKPGMERAELQVDHSLCDSNLKVSASAPRFSANGKYVFFTLQQPPNKRLNAKGIKVDVWSYRDVVIQSKQLGTLSQSANAGFAAVFMAGRKGCTRLENEDDKVLTFPESVTGDYVVVKDNNSVTEPWWNLTSQPSAYLMSLKDGSRKVLINGMQRGDLMYVFSPDGEWLIYFDSKQKNYVSYNTRTGRTLNFTQNIPSSLCIIRGKLDTYIPVGIAGWVKEDGSLLIYDNYDIWQVDPAGSRPPVNITNNYGRNHQIKFTLVDGAEFMQPAIMFKKKDKLLLTAYNSKNKANGFFQMTLGRTGDPQLLVMDSAIIYQKASLWVQHGMRPFKARDANSWVVCRERATEAPNFYLTHDFKGYVALTNIAPQKKYNWLTAELMNWKQLDGTNGQGILYKPENFDANKKYPVIFLYYEDETNRLHTFPVPGVSNTAEINIPWFVSNGYLVCMPDIDFSIATKSEKTTGENAYNAVVSAAQYLSKLPWVDASRMGINGHSTGGGETNYILANSNLFAAAVEGAGVSNNVSDYGSLSGGGENRQFREDLMGATLWQRPDLYMRNSAVFRADKVTTPLLIMHNKKDGSVPWGQGVELFLALRRLGKKVWMLQYDDEGHGIYGDDNAKDFSLRLSQFFDHYLKGAPAPEWMTKGVPAKLKGVEPRYGLDTNNKNP